MMSAPAVEPPFGSFAAPGLLKWLIGADDISTLHPQTGWRRKVAKRYLRWTGRTYDVLYRGLRLRLEPALNAGDFQIVLHGQHEEEDEFDVFEEVAPRYDSFVDIGANIGLYSIMACRVMSSTAKIVAFEPAPDTHKRLKENLALNGQQDRVQVVRAGVGPQAGQLPLMQQNRWNAGRNTMATEAGQGGTNVPVVRLDETLRDLGIDRVGILKIDIEGFEDRALAPYFEATDPSHWPSYILLETCHRAAWETDLTQVLLDAGYRIAFENARNMHFERRPV